MVPLRGAIAMKIYRIANIDRAKVLMQEIDNAYASGNAYGIEDKEQELETLLEQIYAEDDDLEPDITEIDYQDDDESQGGMQDQLYVSYEQYINHLSPFDWGTEESKKNLLGQIVWDTILKAGGRFKKYVNFSDVIPQDIDYLINIAKDAYEHKTNLIRNRRKGNLLPV